MGLNAGPLLVEGAPYKFAALERIEILIARTFLLAAKVKLILAIALVLVGVLIFKTTDFVARRL